MRRITWIEFTISGSTSFVLSLVLFAALGLLAGCGGAARGLSAGSFERGEAEYHDGSYLDAIDDLKLFIRRNPADERADDAQYTIGLAYMEREDYPIAAVEFEILRKDYPSSELFDDAYFQQGMCYVEQVVKTRLEQSTAQEGIVHFRRYLREQPEGVYREQVEEQLISLQAHLDRKKLNTAKFYFRNRRYESAQIYLAMLLERAESSPLREEALELQARVESKLAEQEAAKAAKAAKAAPAGAGAVEGL